MKKLSLKKTVISNLTDSEQEEIQGGISSRRNCTGFMCCDPSFSDTCCTSKYINSCDIIKRAFDEDGGMN
ncbi:hypothetical protein DWB61_09745 [Ancylomarina euxinus]|uniref:Uncharacterized protein n=1 Tax=Ancylomarina euxinus TaxID=2283627 RepID=A0A425Y103_9BACT|nr:class I lanthipeptide [Ancylomarina euxinus]MCZ4693789.1 class I lanthipeptide [Ancylomarina euxinus]MUP15131.1 hypothetical protein [Ancylomarina euxinus]RRG21554.1 hypothetical protein DWB61_09745 [Ancylomarina euxinus]